MMQKNRLRRGSTGKSAWRRRERGNSLAPRYKRRSDAPPPLALPQKAADDCKRSSTHTRAWKVPAVHSYLSVAEALFSYQAMPCRTCTGSDSVVGL